MLQGRKQYFKSGSWNALCDVCGLKFKSHELLVRWDGMRVCRSDFEVRHPLDFVRNRPETEQVSWSRPKSDEDALTTVATGTTTLIAQTDVIVTATGNCTINMPIATVSTVPFNYGIRFTRTDTTAFTVTIQGQGGNLIQYAATLLMLPSSQLFLVSDGVSLWLKQ